MLKVGMGALIAAMAATGAYAQSPSALSPLNAAAFNGGKALPTEWRETEVKGGSTKLKVSLGGVTREPSGIPALAPSARSNFETRNFDVSVTQQWPSAVRIEAGDQDLEITPHAEVGFSDAGPGA